MYVWCVLRCVVLCVNVVSVCRTKGKARVGREGDSRGGKRGNGMLGL